MASGALSRAVRQANEILPGHPNEDQVNARIAALAAYVQGALGDAASGPPIFQELFYSVWLGFGFELLELASGQQLPQLVHPTIWNAMVFTATQAQSDGVDPALQNAYDKAREGGYVASRHQLAPEEVFSGCAFGDPA